jgi:uncharacterized ferritin-like protein (DUF455 family)
MRSVAEAAIACLMAADPGEKVRRTLEAADTWRAGGLAPPASDAPAPPERPPAPVRPRLVPPHAVARRRLTSARGRAALVHALAHIEHNAIGLAWDCVARFRGLPLAFYDDWVAVAADEARHFAALRARLREMGCDYGDFDAHDGLWEMARKTAHDLVARMALVPRVLEARALDVTPGMIERLRAAGDERTAAILVTILEEEVAHVAAGSRWFRFACERRGLDPVPTFRETVARYWTGRMPAPTNFAHRRRAGFEDAELAGWGTPADPAD